MGDWLPPASAATNSATHDFRHHNFFRWGQFPGVVSARLGAWRLTELLGQHGSDSSGGGVHFHRKWNLGIWMVKVGSRAEGSLEFLEGFVGTGVPGQGLGLSLEHGSQWGSMQAEIFD